MEAGDIGAASQELKFACLISKDISAASCIVQLPADCTARVEAIGRDDEGGFLRMEDGYVLRIPTPQPEAYEVDDHEKARKIWLSDLDELLAKDEVVIHELDEFQSPKGEYSVEKLPYGSRMGFGA